VPTRLELIAEAFPLHYQRIVEETYRQVPSGEAREYLGRETSIDAFDALTGAFYWDESAEGYDYWAAFAFWNAARTRGN
jgi:hypothetical protein